jgi:hypothetical protein
VPRIGRLSLCLLVLVQAPAIAGEIPGITAALPPYVEQRLGLIFSNDFLGRGGSVDDFRTQQIIFAVKPAERWSLLLDHSVLTLSDPSAPGRTDQLSGSLGYDIFNKRDSDRIGRFTAGAGFRSSGDFAGERMQNGFHRLIGSKVEMLPYTDTSRTDATIWFDTEHYRALRNPADNAGLGSWRIGSWWRVNSLVTSDGQLDSSAALYAVANRRRLDFWLGLRRDWRSGYDAPVLRETAAAEDDLSVVFGVRFGALILETVQQLNNDASYGQLRLVSSGALRKSSANPAKAFGIEAGFLLPDVYFHLAGRMRTSLLTAGGSAWRESTFLSVDYGEPQYGDNSSVFVRSAQLGVGLEWEHTLSAKHSWLSVYGSVGAGWREEMLLGDGALAGEQSSSVGRAVVLLGTGVRVEAARLGARWNYRIQLGASGSIPTDDAVLQIGAMIFPVQDTTLNLMLGMTFDFE